MEQTLADLVRWMTALPPLSIYALILVVAYGENVLPPIPGDMIVVFGGYLASLGSIDPVMVVAVSTLGGVAGFMTMYAIGARLGTALLDPHRLRWLPKARLERARHHLSRWGYRLVAANRFLSGLRSVISLSVGMAHMPAGVTAMWSAVSALVWTTLLAGAGWVIGENWEVVGLYLRRYGWAVGGLIAVFVAVQFVYWLRGRRPGAVER